MMNEQPPNLTIRGGPERWEKIVQATKLLAETELLVGFPESEKPRDQDGEEQGPITNAALAYIHDQGAPEQRIPQREFMRPAIEGMREEIQRRLMSMAQSALRGNVGDMEVKWTALGLRAKLAIQNKINEGVPPPLSETTLKRRAAKGRKGAAQELANRAKGEAPSVDLAKPLVDSGQLRNAANYALRKKVDRKD